MTTTSSHKKLTPDARFKVKPAELDEIQEIQNKLDDHGKKRENEEVVGDRFDSQLKSVDYNQLPSFIKLLEMKSNDRISKLHPD